MKEWRGSLVQQGEGRGAGKRSLLTPIHSVIYIQGASTKKYIIKENEGGRADHASLH